jgi:hypothetical protein
MVVTIVALMMLSQYVTGYNAGLNHTADYNHGFLVGKSEGKQGGIPDITCGIYNTLKIKGCDEYMQGFLAGWHTWCPSGVCKGPVLSHYAMGYNAGLVSGRYSGQIGVYDIGDACDLHTKQLCDGFFAAYPIGWNQTCTHGRYGCVTLGLGGNATNP